MRNLAKKIKQCDLEQIDESSFSKQHTGCIVLTQDKKILLQQRPENWRTFPGKVATFGGLVEVGETPVQAIIRELNEELGARVQASEIVELGAVTEEFTQHSELVYLFFWHDKKNTITGCYECDAKYFNTVAEALACPKLMDDVRWALIECQNNALFM